MLSIVKDGANKVKNSVSGFLGLNEKTNIQPKEDTVKLVTDIAADVSYVIEYLLKLHSCKSKEEFGKHVDRGALFYLASLKDKLVSLKNKLNDTEEANPSIKDFSIIKFCRSIIENDKINKELNDFSTKCSNLKQSNYYEEFSSHLDKIVKNFNIHQLQKKMSFLSKLEGKSDFSSLIKEYKNVWDAYDLLKDKDFRQYVDKTVVDDYIKSAKQGKEAASKCFGEEVEFQAFCTKADDGTYVLNVNVDRGSGSEPTQIEGESIQINDFLQKDVHELNVYRNKELEVWVHKYEDNRRDYEFKKGVSYEMTSTWPVKDESGKVSMCTMVMNVGNGGITKILKLNDGEEFEFQREDILELARKNSELRIQGCFLYDAINKYWGVQTGEKLRAAAEVEEGKKPGFTVPDVVPVAGRASQNTTTTLNQSNDKKPDPTDGPGSTGSAVATNTLLNNDASSKCIFPDSSSSTLPEAQSPSTPNLDPSPQGSDFAIVNDTLNKEREVLKEEVSRLNTKNMEFEQEARAVLQVMKQQCTKMKAETQTLHVELERTRAEKGNLNQKLAQIEQVNEQLKGKLEELSEKNGDLQAELEKKKQEVKVEKDKIQEFHIVLQEKAQELEVTDKEKEELTSNLRVAYVNNTKLKNEVGKLKKELKDDSVEAVRIMCQNNKVIQDLKFQMCTLEQKYEEQQELLEQKVKDQKWEIEELKNNLSNIKNDLSNKCKELESEKKKFLENDKVVHNFNSQISELERKSQEQQKRNGTLRWEITKLENALEVKGKELELCEQKLIESREEAEGLDDENERLSKKIEELENNLRNYKWEIEGLDRQVQELNEKTYPLTGDVHQAVEKLVKGNLEYMFLAGMSDVGDIILPKKRLSRSASLESSYDSELDNQGSCRSSSLGSCDSGLDQELPSTELTGNVSVSGFHQTRVKAIYVR